MVGIYLRVFMMMGAMVGVTFGLLTAEQFYDLWTEAFVYIVKGGVLGAIGFGVFLGCAEIMKQKQSWDEERGSSVPMLLCDLPKKDRLGLAVGVGVVVGGALGVGVGCARAATLVD